MRLPHESDWDEFKDPEIVDWKRVRAAIEHENTLTNQRVTWLLVGQGFLLGAYMAVFGPIMKGETKSDMLPYSLGTLVVIVLAGLLLSIFLSRGVQAAFEQHNRLKKWWNDRPKADPNRHPRICGEEPQFRAFTIPYYKFPWLFLPVWVLLLALVLAKFLQETQLNINVNGLVLAMSIFVAIVAVFIIGVWYAKHSNDKSAG